jgi:hypothetical protein
MRHTIKGKFINLTFEKYPLERTEWILYIKGGDVYEIFIIKLYCCLESINYIYVICTN